MRLSENQYQRLADAEFVERVILLLREEIPTLSAEFRDEELRLMVRYGMNAARSYRLVTEQHLVEFILNMLTIHPQFHEQRDIHAALTDFGQTADERMAAVLEAVPEAAWDEAAAYPCAKDYWTAVLLAAPPLDQGKG